MGDAVLMFPRGEMDMCGFDGTGMDWSNACPLNEARKKERKKERE